MTYEEAVKTLFAKCCFIGRISWVHDDQSFDIEPSHNEVSFEQLSLLATTFGTTNIDVSPPSYGRCSMCETESEPVEIKVQQTTLPAPPEGGWEKSQRQLDA